VGGGVVLDPAPPRTADLRRLNVLADGDPLAIARVTIDAPVTRAEVGARGLLAPHELDAGLGAVSSAEGWFFSDAWLQRTAARAEAELRERERTSPLEPGVPVAELLDGEPWAAAVLPLLDAERRGTHVYRPGTSASLAGHAAAAAELEARLGEAGIAAVKVSDAGLARFLERQRRLVRLGDGWAIGADAYLTARDILLRECESAGGITLARFRDLVGTGRRDAQLLLERFDSDGITRRVGDRRLLRRSVREGARPD
jgi:selenocysteine-specific elongation factor